MKKQFDVIIIGAGPAGIFCALELLQHQKDLRVLMLEKGRIHRACPKKHTGRCMSCQPCQISTGWGGSGAFSDGKLSLDSKVGGELPSYVGDISEDIAYCDSIYLRYGGNPQVCYEVDFANALEQRARPYGLELIHCPIRHLGSEKSAQIMLRMYEDIIAHPGVEVRDLTPAKDLLVKEGAIGGVVLENGETCLAPYVVACVGRNGSQWLKNVCDRHGIPVSDKDIDIGVRVECPRQVMDHLTDKLYEVKLIYHHQNKVRTFCMNPGGVVSQENYDGDLAVVNGHSYHSYKTPNTNFALLTSLHLEPPFQDSTRYGRTMAALVNQVAGGHILVQRLADLKQQRATRPEDLQGLSITPTLPDAVAGDLRNGLTAPVLEPILACIAAMDHLCPGLDGENTLLYGPEVKFYSSKVQVDSRMRTSLPGFYAIGDGAGITRGLMQASVSGVRTAKDILERLRNR